MSTLYLEIGLNQTPDQVQIQNCRLLTWPFICVNKMNRIILDLKLLWLLGNSELGLDGKFL